MPAVRCRRILTLVVALGFAGCGDDGLTLPTPVDPPLLSTAELCRKSDSLQAVLGPHLTIDDHFELLGHLLPGGFGGLWSEGMWLAYPHRVADTRTAASRLAACNGVKVSNLVFIQTAPVHHGRFDYVQLRRWYRVLQSEPWLWGGVDEARNRLEFAFATEEARHRFLGLVAELHIPSIAVHTVIESPARPG